MPDASASSEHLAGLRQDYTRAGLKEADAGGDPLVLFQRWFSEAERAGVPEPNALTLATAGADGTPHARIVLLKGLDNRGFHFYTNYQSAKGTDLEANPRAALVFFWQPLERQVRVEGSVEKLPAEESDQYFNSRPAGSRIGARASAQSRPATNRAELEAAYAVEKAFYPEEIAIPRPPHWGGYVVVPRRIEFWQGRLSRLHDRIVFTLGDGVWHTQRLQP